MEAIAGFVGRVNDFEMEKFLKELPKYYYNGLGRAEVLFSSPESKVVSLFNADGVRLANLELHDFFCQLIWSDSRAYVEVDLEAINKLWVRTLRRLFHKAYEEQYLAYHDSILYEV